MEQSTIPTENLLHQLQTTTNGLTSEEARLRLAHYGPNQLVGSKVNGLKILWRQLTGNSLSLILVGVSIVSYLTGDPRTAYYVVGMVALSVVLGFWNEYSSEKTVSLLLKRISLQVMVIRDNKKQEVPIGHLTIGDLVLLTPGNIVPADLRLLSAEELEVDESVLTGESEPVHKAVSTVITKKGAKALNNLFMGTEVTNGSGSGVVVAIGQGTEFGKIAQISSFARPATQFQKGLSSFGTLIIKTILVLTVIIFVVNALLGHHILDSLLFALAVAVGLTPELLPVVVTVGLSRGAGKLAKHDVITKQLIAIENLGNMDVLCTDKTGTLTEGRISVERHIDENGRDSKEVLTLGLLCNNATTQHKIVGPSIDVALWHHAQETGVRLTHQEKKIFQAPFDYSRQMMYAVALYQSKPLLIINGAPEKVLEQCRGSQAHQLKKYHELSKEGLRVIALATKEVAEKQTYSWEETKELTFRGFVTLLDTPKPSARLALEHLERLGVAVKIITGDNEVVARSVAEKVGMKITGVITGNELPGDKQSLTQAAQNNNIFARVSPEQKLKIIETLSNLGHTVGYMGDGVNDVPSLHSADVGISVNTAVDVAKEAAQIVLLRQGLDVIVAGIQEGRKTFINTLKYILMGTGSNFGEMASASIASFFLPFLPMTPPQILVENSLYDISQIPIASDNVDDEALLKPKHWDIRLIFSFMIFFGILSALYTIGIFLIMLLGFHAHSALFQTAWFIEALTTEMVVVLVVRTVRVPFFRSLPSAGLLLGIVLVTAFGLYLPYSFLANSLGFIAPPVSFFEVMAGLLASYIIIVEITKYHFFKRFSL